MFILLWKYSEWVRGDFLEDSCPTQPHQKVGVFSYLDIGFGEVTDRHNVFLFYNQFTP